MTEKTNTTKEEFRQAFLVKMFQGYAVSNGISLFTEEDWKPWFEAFMSGVQAERDWIKLQTKNL